MIKKLFAAACILASTHSFADPNRALLKKTQDAGFTMPQYWRSMTCTVYANRIEISRSFGGNGITTQETRQINLEGDVDTLIAGSANENFVSNGTMCDAPGTRIVALLSNGSQIEEFLLYGQSTCSEDGERQGENSQVLLNLVNALCGNM